MKKIFCIAIITFLSNLGFAGNGDNTRDAERSKLISGKVIDKTSGEEIAGAEIRINDQILYSDLNGNFSATISTSRTEASVSSVTYNDKKVNIDPFSYTTLIVELESR